MLRFASFGSAHAAVRYFVRDGADCARPEPTPAMSKDPAGRAVGYYSEQGRVVGRWAGTGAAALGLTGLIRTEDEQVLTRLLSGQLPDGIAVAGPVWRPHPDSRLPAAPLLTAIRQTAGQRGLRVDQLLDDDGLRAGFAALSRRVDRDPRTAVPPAQLQPLAAAAGIDLTELFGAGRLAVAVAMAGEKVDVRRAGVDGPVSAPKSVSVLWALADHHTQQAVLAAHRAAVDQAIAYLEREAGHALRGHQGDGQRAEWIPTDGLMVAAFDHHTSRADDPQLHTHLVIANLLHGTDDRWTALDSRALFRAQRTAGYLYQAALRGELTTRLGVTWTKVRNGVAEIDGLPPALLREFSTRRQAIEARLAATGTVSGLAVKVACLDTRPVKTGRPVSELLAGWWARAQQHLPDVVAGIGAVLHRTAPLPDIRHLNYARAAGVLFGPRGVTEHTTSFDRADLTRALLERLPAGTPVTDAELHRAVGTLLAGPGVLPLLDTDSVGRPRYTTVELANTEAAVLRLADADTLIPAVSPERRVMLAAGLSAEQRDALAAVTTSPTAVDVLIGAAGTGKTATLTALHTHYRDIGVPVVGACVAAITARRLQRATGIPSNSVARLLADLNRGGQLPGRCVLVLDEAGMIGSRDYRRLLEATVAVGGKLLAVGDPAQLGEIDAGGMFTRLARHHTRAELTGNHRQTESWERDALTDLRTGRIDQALTAYRAHGRLHRHDSHERLTAQLAEDYLAALDTGTAPLDVLALAATRSGAARLNTAIRTRLQTAGRIGPDRHVDGRRFAEGELVHISRNDYHRDLHNGTRGHITTITDTGQISLQLDDGRTVTVPAGWAADRLRPAYALTIHKAQGITVDVALVDTTGIGDRAAGYVALSRARRSTQIHHLTGVDPADHLTGDPDQVSRLRTGPRHAERDDLGLTLQVQLLRRDAQRLGLDQLDPAADPLHPHHRPHERSDRGYSRSR